MAFGAITLGMLSFNSCKKEVNPIADPTVCFAFAGNLDVGESILFSNCSNDATEYIWDFGDGTSSEIADPSHVYYSPGTYTVELNSFNEEGISNSTSKTITIADKVPVTMIINSITLLTWPQTNNGVAWDDSSYPDIHIYVNSPSGIIHRSDTYIEDCDPAYTYEYGADAGFPLLIEYLDYEYRLDIWDNDVSGYDFMGEINFTPSTLHVFGENTLSIAAGEFSFLLHVRWVY